MRIPSLRRGVMALAGIASGFGCAAAFTLQRKVQAEPIIHPPHLPRSHDGPFDSLDRDIILRGLDRDSIRRGAQVYKQVCSACHSMRHISYRNLMDMDEKTILVQFKSILRRLIYKPFWRQLPQL